MSTSGNPRRSASTSGQTGTSGSGTGREIGGDVIAKQDAYIGEGVKINGKLVVSGALDIGEKVEIKEGFEAKGDIEVRNPMPVFMFIIIYLMTLLKIQNEKELDRILDEIFSEDEEKMKIPLMIPARSRLNMKLFAVPSTMKIGKGCRLHGNIRAGSIDVQQNTVIFGSLRAKNRITVVDGVTVHGNVESGSTVYVKKGAHILGDVIAKSIVLHEEAKDRRDHLGPARDADRAWPVTLMKAAEILGTDSIQFVEPEFADQTETSVQHGPCGLRDG